MRYLKTQGNNYEVGRAIGKAQKGDIKRLLAWLVLDDSYRRKAEKLLPRHAKRFPEYMTELEGIADGADADVKELFAFNCFEDKCSFRAHEEKCTTIYWQGEGKKFIGHNEEEFTANYGRLLLVHAEINGTSFITLNYPMLLCGDTISINSHGLAQAIDTVYPIRVCAKGYARSFIGRALLDCKTLSQSRKTFSTPTFEGLYLLAYSHREGKANGIESYHAKSASRDLNEDGLFVHANHYLLSPFKRIAQDAPVTSHFKVEQSTKLLHNKPVNIETLAKALSDHAHKPLSICRHPSEDLTATATLASVIIDCENMAFCVANGNPCTGRYRQYII